MSWNIIRMRGHGMAPTLLDGDYAVTRNAEGLDIGAGDVALVEHPQLGQIIKRLHSASEEGAFELMDDNYLTSLGKSLGQINRAAIRAHLIWRLSSNGIERL